MRVPPSNCQYNKEKLLNYFYKVLAILEPALFRIKTEFTEVFNWQIKKMEQSGILDNIKKKWSKIESAVRTRGFGPTEARSVRNGNEQTNL